MANLKDLRTRISSVKNTKQLTRAMKMIAAAKLRRVQDKVKESRPFSGEILQMMDAFFSSAVDPTQLSPFFRDKDFTQELKEGKSKSTSDAHLKASLNKTHSSDADLMDQTDVGHSTDSLLKKIDKTPANLRLFVVTSDRGLCGAYNMNVLRMMSEMIKKEEQAGFNVKVDIVGRKGLEFLKRHHPDNLGKYFNKLGSELTRELAVETMLDYRTRFLKGEFDILSSVYTEFINTITQRVKTTTVLPIHPEMMTVEKKEKVKGQQKIETQEKGLSSKMFIIEPSFDALASMLVEAFLDSRFYQLLLESVASEYGARMMSMENASKNAEEMMEKLTLLYNRQRQANITTEMLEITGGAEALSHTG